MIPYFIVAIPAWVYLDLFLNQKGILDVIKDLVFISFFTEGVKWFWYILMAAVCYAIFPWIFRVVESATDKFYVCMKIFGLCVLSQLIPLFLRIYYESLYDDINVMLTRFPAFFVGVLLGKAAYEKWRILNWKIGIIIAAAIVFAWPMKMVYLPLLRVYAAAFLNFSLCLLGILMMEKGANCGRQIIVKAEDGLRLLLGWFGQYTIELYLIHVMVRKIMGYWNMPLYRYVNEIKLIFISVILSVLLKRLTDLIRKSGANIS